MIKWFVCRCKSVKAASPSRLIELNTETLNFHNSSYGALEADWLHAKAEINYICLYTCWLLACVKFLLHLMFKVKKKVKNTLLSTKLPNYF